ncbi:MAG: hypothetical protein H7835_01950 [Magnetococcus sp. XQGC-1]
MRFIFLLSSALFVLLFAGAGGADEFYRCVNEGAPPSIFQKKACELLPDPTLAAQPAVASPPEVSTPVVSSVAVAPLVKPVVPTAGPWSVTQLFFPEVGSGGERQAIVNNLRVGVGAMVDGGRVREITRTGVVMAHAGGETEVPFGREVAATGLVRGAAIPVSLQELGIEPSHLLLWQRLAAGRELLIMHNGLPLARLLPVPVEEK